MNVRTSLPATLTFLTLAACSTSGDEAASASNAGQGGAAAGTTATTTVASTGSVSYGIGGFGGSAATGECNPVAAPGSIYELAGEQYALLSPVSMCTYRGDVMLIVNTAAL